MTTTIDLPAELKRKIEKAADIRGVTFDEYVFEALEWMLEKSEGHVPLYNDNAVFSGGVPEDLSTHHDRYLYNEAL